MTTEVLGGEEEVDLTAAENLPEANDSQEGDTDKDTEKNLAEPHREKAKNVLEKAA